MPKIFEEKIESKIIHFYPQYLFIVDHNRINQEVKWYKLETYNNEFIPFDDFHLTIYDITQYFDNESLAIFNHFYKHDFLYFQYEMIHQIDK